MGLTRTKVFTDNGNNLKNQTKKKPLVRVAFFYSKLEF